MGPRVKPAEIDLTKDSDEEPIKKPKGRATKKQKGTGREAGPSAGATKFNDPEPAGRHREHKSSCLFFNCDLTGGGWSPT